MIVDYSKLPSEVNVDQVFLLDPLIATGGTVREALSMIKEWGYPSTGIFFFGIQSPLLIRIIHYSGKSKALSRSSI